LVIRRRKSLDRVGRERRTQTTVRVRRFRTACATGWRGIHTVRILGPIAFRVQVLVVLLHEQVPVVVELPQGRQPEALVGYRIRGVSNQRPVGGTGSG